MKITIDRKNFTITVEGEFKLGDLFDELEAIVPDIWREYKLDLNPNVEIPMIPWNPNPYPVYPTYPTYPTYPIDYPIVYGPVVNTCLNNGHK